jgi:acetyl esterase/lipase
MKPISIVDQGSFMAGGIQCGEMLLNFDGQINGKSLDKSYKPDSLDKISANVSADGMIYSFYGVLSIASKDVNELKRGDLPPTYFCYGTRDPFVSEFEANIKCLIQAGVEVETHIMKDWPHGYGAQGDWITKYAQWLEKIFSRNK